MESTLTCANILIEKKNQEKKQNPAANMSLRRRFRQSNLWDNTHFFVESSKQAKRNSKNISEHERNFHDDSWLQAKLLTPHANF